MLEWSSSQVESSEEEDTSERREGEQPGEGKDRGRRWYVTLTVSGLTRSTSELICIRRRCLPAPFVPVKWYPTSEEEREEERTDEAIP